MYRVNPYITEQSTEYANETKILEFVNMLYAIEREIAFPGKVIDGDDKNFALLN